MKILITALALALSLVFSGPAFCVPTNKQPVALVTQVTTLMQKISQGDKLFMVDIRPAKAFSQFKIPGSLNVKASLIKTKAFLKTRPVILIHQGFDHRELISKAKDLNTKGFNVSVLQGGIAAWKHKGGTLVGNPFSFKTVNTILPRDFFAGKTQEDWLIIDVSSQGSKKTTIPEAMVLSAGKSAEKSKNDTTTRIGHILTSTKMSETASIIIFDESGSNYAGIMEQFPVHYRHKVFGLTGGSNAYQDFTTTHMLANRPKSERTKEIGNCEPCKNSKPE